MSRILTKREVLSNGPPTLGHHFHFPPDGTYPPLLMLVAGWRATGDPDWLSHPRSSMWEDWLYLWQLRGAVLRRMRTPDDVARATGWMYRPVPPSRAWHPPARAGIDSDDVWAPLVRYVDLVLRSPHADREFWAALFPHHNALRALGYPVDGAVIPGADRSVEWSRGARARRFAGPRTPAPRWIVVVDGRAVASPREAQVHRALRTHAGRPEDVELDLEPLRRERARLERAAAKFRIRPGGGALAIRGQLIPTAEQIAADESMPPGLRAIAATVAETVAAMVFSDTTRSFAIDLRSAVAAGRPVRWAPGWLSPEAIHARFTAWARTTDGGLWWFPPVGDPAPVALDTLMNRGLSTTWWSNGPPNGAVVIRSGTRVRGVIPRTRGWISREELQRALVSRAMASPLRAILAVVEQVYDGQMAAADRLSAQRRPDPDDPMLAYDDDPYVYVEVGRAAVDEMVEDLPNDADRFGGESYVEAAIRLLSEIGEPAAEPYIDALERLNV